MSGSGVQASICCGPCRGQIAPYCMRSIHAMASLTLLCKSTSPLSRVAPAGSSLGRWMVLVLAMLLASPAVVAATIYVWTDDAGVVHMTDDWERIPPSMRPRVAVHESSQPIPPEAPASVESTRPAPAPKPLAGKLPPLEISPDIAEVPGSSPPPSAIAEPQVTHRHPLRHHARPSLPHARPLLSPFPLNVQLDPVDPDVVRIGQSRVRKDALAYPRMSLEDEAKFQARLRALEQRRLSSPKSPQARPPRP